MIENLKIKEKDQHLVYENLFLWFLNSEGYLFVYDEYFEEYFNDHFSYSFAFIAAEAEILGIPLLEYALIHRNAGIGLWDI